MSTLSLFLGSNKKEHIPNTPPTSPLLHWVMIHVLLPASPQSNLHSICLQNNISSTSHNVFLSVT